MMFNTLALERLVEKRPFSTGGSRPTALTPPLATGLSVLVSDVTRIST